MSSSAGCGRLRWKITVYGSGASTFWTLTYQCLSGSNSTRLLKHGMAGHVVETVELSWMAKPCGVSSRWATLSTPPDLGADPAALAWPATGAPWSSSKPAAPSAANEKANRRGRIVTPPAEVRRMRECNMPKLPLRVSASAHQRVQHQVDPVDHPAGEAAHHGAVDPDELQIVAGVLLDQLHRALGPQ